MRDHERIRRRLRPCAAAWYRTPRPVLRGWERLTEPGRKLIPLVVDVLTNRAKAERLPVSVHTVNTHMKHIFAKLGVRSAAAGTPATVSSSMRPPG
ncbi:helix-turn-helix transcriptional regulator [Streptomyces sp. NBC_00271]|uniref:helix-turn-helix transcriptional regulator n=1 Tax=Streptomyces sp. NBC_00271 TaxID=2975697 RepID=UPI003FA6F45C